MKKTISIIIMVLLLVLSVAPAVAGNTSTSTSTGTATSSFGTSIGISTGTATSSFGTSIGISTGTSYGVSFGPGSTTGEITKTSYNYTQKKSNSGVSGQNIPVYAKLSLSGIKIDQASLYGSRLEQYWLSVVPTKKTDSVYLEAPNGGVKVQVTWYYKTKSMKSYKKWTGTTDMDGFLIVVPAEAQYKGAKFYAQLTQKMEVYSTSVGNLSKSGVKLKTSEQIGKIVYKNKTKVITTTSKSKVLTLK